MGDPERLLGPGSDSDELERELLGSIRNVSPPPGAKGRAWEGIAATVAVATAVGVGTATVGSATAHAAATGMSAGAKLLTAKVVLGVALAGSTLAAGGYWVSHQMAQRTVVAPRPERRPAPESPAPPPAAAPAVIGEPTPAPCDAPQAVPPCPTAAAPIAPTAPERAPRVVDEPHARNLLGVESRMLTEARAQLRGGEPRGAMATLERLQTRFPKGVLLQEREVLTIQVLSALGDNAAATRKAKAFLEAYPNSPHAPQIRRFAGD
jgi:hypothetical protein